MKLSKLLPIVFLAGIGLAACNQGPSEPVDTNVYTVSISNKTDIEAEWHVGDAYRTLTVAATKNGEAVNAAQLLNREIFVTSSNTNVLSAQGFVLTALSAGTTTVTVKYHGVEDTLNLTIERKLTCIDKYGTVHAGTEEDPLDNADALKVGKYVKDNSKTSTDENDIYIKGVVDEWYHFPGERSDKYTSWYIQKAEADESRFEMYKVLKSDESALSDEEVWPGAEVLVYGPIGFYGSTFETTAATFVRVTGGAQRVAPELKQTTVNAKNTGALAVGKALNDGNTTWDRYEITGYTVNFLGTQGKDANKTYNYMIADSKTETDAAKQFEIYACKQELKFNAKVKVTSRIKNYHNTIETNVLESVQVLEEGTDWVEYPEPAAIENKTLADLFADESGNYKQAYVVTGIVSKWDSKNGTPNENGTAYGNFYLKVDADATEEYYIYGATATASALEWSKYANKYGFVNPKDFLTNNVTKNIQIGDKLTMKLVRCDYKKTVDGVETVTPEACGIVLQVGDLPQGAIKAEFNLTSYATEQSISGGTQVSSIAVVENIVTATASSGTNTGKIYTSDAKVTEWRFYKSESGTLTISVAQGYTLLKVTAGLAKSNYGTPADTDVEIANNAAVISSTALNSNFNIKTLVVYYIASVPNA